MILELQPNIPLVVSVKDTKCSQRKLSADQSGRRRWRQTLSSLLAATGQCPTSISCRPQPIIRIRCSSDACATASLPPGWCPEARPSACSSSASPEELTSLIAIFSHSSPSTLTSKCDLKHRWRYGASDQARRRAKPSRHHRTLPARSRWRRRARALDALHLEERHGSTEPRTEGEPSSSEAMRSI